jgi:cell division protein FtsQ
MKNWLKISLSVLFTGGIITLLSFMYKSQNDASLTKPEISIHVEGENAFLTELELYDRLYEQKLLFVGQKFSEVNFELLESEIRLMPEVKSVEVFTRIGSRWSINVELRKPIARVFNKMDQNFYLDDDGFTMHPSSLHTARVMIVTGDISDKLNGPSVPDLINNDSLKSILRLDDVYRITSYVCNDPFLLAQIAQIHLEPNGDFVLTPQVGGHKIVFGSAHTEKEVADKFFKLKVFYEKGIPYEGWDKYSEIVLKYENQIVCKKK